MLRRVHIGATYNNILRDERSHPIQSKLDRLKRQAHAAAVSEFIQRTMIVIYPLAEFLINGLTS